MVLFLIHGSGIITRRGHGGIKREEKYAFCKQKNSVPNSVDDVGNECGVGK